MAANGKVALGPLESTRVRLRPVMPTDVDWLYLAATDPWALYRWRLRGQVPSLPEFAMFLAQDEAMMITSRETGAPFGLVQAFQKDEYNCTASLSVLLTEDASKRGWPAEGILVFVNHLFRSRPLRKLNVQVTAQARDLYSYYVRNGLLVEEGCLRGHELEDGEPVDVYVLACHRAAWERARERYGYG